MKSSSNGITNVEQAEVISGNSSELEKQLSTSIYNIIEHNIPDQFDKTNYMLPSTSSTTHILNFSPKKIITKDNTVIPNSVPKTKTVTRQECGITSKQMILFKQQLTQYIQLITQTYLLSTMDTKFKYNLKKLKNMLVSTLFLLCNSLRLI